MEELYIKKIKGGIIGINNGTKTPEEANIGRALNNLKAVNEGMYSDLMNDYKAALAKYNASKNN